MDLDHAVGLSAELWFVVMLAKALAWPIVVTAAICAVRPHLGKVAESFGHRGVTVKGFGVEAKFDALEQQKESKAINSAKLGAAPVTTAVVPAATSSALAPPPTAAAALLEQELSASLDDLHLDAAGQRAILLRELTTSRLQKGHEYVYNRIFGSQILALKRLDDRGGLGATVQDAKTFFEPYVQQSPEFYARYGFDGWLGFLVSNRLIKRDGDRLEATEFGHDFLVYLVDSRLSVEKPL